MESMAKMQRTFKKWCLWNIKTNSINNIAHPIINAILKSGALVSSSCCPLTFVYYLARIVEITGPLLYEGVYYGWRMVDLPRGLKPNGADIIWWSSLICLHYYWYYALDYWFDAFLRFCSAVIAWVLKMLSAYTIVLIKSFSFTSPLGSERQWPHNYYPIPRSN